MIELYGIYKVFGKNNNNGVFVATNLMHDTALARVKDYRKNYQNCGVRFIVKKMPTAKKR